MNPAARAWERTRARLLASRRARYGLALALHLVLAPLVIHDWDGFVFLRAAQDWLAGASPYAVAEADPWYVHVEDRWPPLNTWYAYPPLPLILFTPFVALASWLTGEPMVLRLALKLPFVLGNLGLAFVVGALAARMQAPGADAGAARARAELLVLLNPFLLFIAAGWGMFDAAMMALLLGALLLLLLARPAWAGASFGAATLLKLFPLFVAPLFLVFAWRRLGARAAAVFATAAAGLFALVCLPFLLAAPQGFLHQTLLMHGARGLQGFALVSAPRHAAWVLERLGLPPVMPGEDVLVSLSGALLLGVGLLVLARSRDALRPAQVVSVALLGFLGVLLVSKVVNEQYLVMPVALLALLASAPEGDAVRARAGLRAFTWGGLASSLLLGFHFLTFIPRDVTERWLPEPPEAILHHVSVAFDAPFLVILLVPHLLAVVVLLPAFWWTLRFVAPHLRAAWADATALLAAASPRGPSRRAASVALALALAVLLVASPATTALLQRDPAPAAGAVADRPEPEGRVVLFSVDLAVRNPSHDPDVRNGYWLHPGAPRPHLGYYTLTSAKLRDDLALFRTHGVDGILVGIDAGNGVGARTVHAAALESGIRVGLVLDARQLAWCPEAQDLPRSGIPPVGAPPEERHEPLLRACLSHAYGALREAPAALRHEGRPVLFVDGAWNDTPEDWLPRAVRESAPDAWIVVRHPAHEEARWGDHAAPLLAPRDATPEGFDALRGALSNDSAPFAIAPLLPAFGPGGALSGNDVVRATARIAQEADARWIVVPWNQYRLDQHAEPAHGEDWWPAVLEALRALDGFDALGSTDEADAANAADATDAAAT